jgi:DNA-directed RNA polymerase subunit RPC12/RpoP
MPILRPKPSELFLITGPSGRRIHYAYRLYKVPQRLLCSAKFGQKKQKPSKILKTGKVTCPYCKKRMATIERLIAQDGIEWTCEGRWVPLEERVYKDVGV